MKAGNPTDTSSRIPAFLCLALMVLLLVLPGWQAHADDSHTPMEPIPCPGVEVDDGGVSCFIAHMPADWSNISGRDMELPVMRFAPLEGEASLPPLLVLMGGPGQSAIYMQEPIAKNLRPFRKNRELILMDQRGTGPFADEIACDDARGKHEAIEIEKLVECARQATESGYRFADYDSFSTARDYRALRYALKIDKWAILATSYGARVAQHLIEIDEKGIDRILFNAPLFNQILFFDWDPLPLVETVVEACDGDEACREAYPGLYWDFTALPYLMQKVKVGEDDLPPALQSYLYMRRLRSLLHRHRAGELPKDIAQVHQTVREAVAHDRIWTPPDPLPQSMRQVGLFMHFAILCEEEMPRMAKQGLHDLKQPLQIVFYRQVCEDLHKAMKARPQLPKHWDQGRKSKLPVLILNGSLDTLVEPESPGQVLPLYPNGRWLQMPHAGHDVFSNNACAKQIGAAFLEGSAASGLDITCLEEIKLIFKTGN